VFKRLILLVLLLVASCPRLAPAQTTALYAGNVQVPSILLNPFNFTIPAGSTGTLWVGDAGTTPALRATVLLFTMDGKYIQNFSSQGGAINHWPGLPAGDYMAVAFFMYSGGGTGTDYFVVNLTVP